MGSVNKQILVGYVGNDPDIKYLKDGTAVANFSLATSKKYKNKNGEKVENTNWHNIVAWRKLAELVEKYVVKGSQLYLEGESITRSWEDKDGVKRYTTEVIINRLQLVGGKDTSDGNKEQQSPDYDGPDDLPY